MINQIKEALMNATNGTWNKEGKEIWRRGTGYEGVINHVWICDVPNGDNAHLIANSPTYIYYLLNQNEALQNRIQELELIEARHKELLAIIRRAERIASQNVEHERDIFKMDANGNLKRIKE